MIGNANGAYILRTQAGFRQHVSADLESACPYLLTIMFNPAVLRKILLELCLDHRFGLTLGIKDNGAAARGALVDGENMLGHKGGAPVCMRLL